jgi:hypothetical protein
VGDPNASSNPLLWTWEGEDPPESGAPASNIAQYLEDIIIPEMRYSGNCSSNPVWFGPIPRWRLRRYCEAAGYPWNAVAMELRSREYARTLSVRDEADTCTPLGVEVRSRAIEGATYGLEPLCPFFRRSVSKSSFRVARWKKDCDSWGCPRCGVTLADSLLRHLASVLLQVPEVFIGRASWRSTQAGTMAYRRRTAGAQMFWYRDVTGNVTYISDRPLPGNVEPTFFTAMLSDDALDVVKATFWVPGHRDHGWSEGWDINDPDEDTHGTEEFFDVVDLSEKELQRVMAIFADEDKSEFGVDVATGYIPPRHEKDLVRLMEDVLAQVRSRVRST